MTALKHQPLTEALRHLLQRSRSALQQSVNSTMEQTYRQVGQLIVEDEKIKDVKFLGDEKLQKIPVILFVLLWLSFLGGIMYWYEAKKIKELKRLQALWKEFLD